MSSIIVSTISDCIASIALNAVNKHTDSFTDELLLKSSLKEYIESQRKYNELVSLGEEIDFQGLAEYIENNLMSDVDTWLYGKSTKERASARSTIIAKATCAANADSDEAKSRAIKSVSVALNIIRDCSRRHIPKQLKMIAAEATDEIIAYVKDEAKGIKDNQKKLENDIKHVAESIETMNSNQLSIENAVLLAKDNQWSTIEDRMDSFIKHLSAEHPLAPDYGVVYDSGFKSVPLTDEAVNKYPPRLELSCDLYSGGKKLNDPIEDILDYHKRHQQSITIDVKNATQYLGDIRDPFQYEAKLSSGSKFTLHPPQLSKTIPCSIKVRDKVFFDLVYIKIQEILDDETLVIGNQDSESDINFELRINPSDQEHPQFAVKTRKLTNRDYLKIASFYCDLDKYRDLHIYCLTTSEDLIAGTIDFSMKTDFGSWDAEVDFIKRICEIEDYFNLTLPTPRVVTNKEYSLITHISNLIREETVNYPWSQLNFTITLNPQWRTLITALNGSMDYIYYIKDDACSIFDTEIKIRYIRYIEKAAVLNYDKVVKKLDVLEDGDMIKITVVPETEDAIFDSLRIPDELDYNKI